VRIHLLSTSSGNVGTTNRRVDDKTHSANRFSRKARPTVVTGWTLLNAISLFGFLFLCCTASAWPQVACTSSTQDTQSHNLEQRIGAHARIHLVVSCTNSAIPHGLSHHRPLAHQKYDKRYSREPGHQLLLHTQCAYMLSKRHCDTGILLHIIFPSCWNARDATSAKFMDHVSCPVGTQEGGTCPNTHPDAQVRARYPYRVLWIIRRRICLIYW